jgi:hypothetical protein
MRHSKKNPNIRWDDEFLEHDLDPYSENFDDEEAISSGSMKGFEAAFLRGFRRFN